MDEFLKYPNCPDSEVCLVAVGRKYKKAIKALYELKLGVLQLSEVDFLNTSISNHADMLLTHIGSDKLITFKENKDINHLLNLGIEIKIGETPTFSYPKDALYNILCLGNFVFYNPNSADQLLINTLMAEGRTLVPVKQGYSKCSCAVLSKTAVITSDRAIASSANRVGVDVLLIRPGFIELKGYDYGFIGGCCGLISKDKLAVCGNIQTHPDYDEIKKFTQNHNVEILSLYNGPLEDIGSIIPLKQKVL